MSDSALDELLEALLNEKNQSEEEKVVVEASPLPSPTNDTTETADAKNDNEPVESTSSSKKEKAHYHGHRSRLKERFLVSPKGTMPDYEILELILFSAHPRNDVKPYAKELIQKFGSLAKVLNASQSELKKMKGVNPSALTFFKVIQEAAERLIKADVTEKPILASWHALIDYCRASMGHLKKEQFRILFVDKKNRLIADELQETGTVDQTPVYPREVVKQALELEASAMILVHNHPSGDVTPSRADISLTKEIINAAQTLGIKVHDHVIVSASKHYSFKSHQLI